MFPCSVAPSRERLLIQWLRKTTYGKHSIAPPVPDRHDSIWAFTVILFLSLFRYVSHLNGRVMLECVPSVGRGADYFVLAAKAIITRDDERDGERTRGREEKGAAMSIRSSPHGRWSPSGASKKKKKRNPSVRTYRMANLR